MKTEIMTPKVPDLIFVQIADQGVNVSIAEFTIPELEEIGKKWTNDLIARAEKLRKEPKITIRKPSLENVRGSHTH